MGLDTTHDAWHGPYSQFMRWRCWLAAQIGIPLRLMEAFYEWEWEDGDLTFERDYMQITGPRELKNGQQLWSTLEGFRDLGRPIAWSALNGDPIVKLLHHSDCDGRLRWWDCKPLAIRLLGIYRKSEASDKAGHGPDVHRGCYDSMRMATKRFAIGCLRAYKSKEDIVFR